LIKLKNAAGFWQLAEPNLSLPECVLEEYGEDIDHHRAVRPAFDALWNAMDYPRAKFFNANGLWVGKGDQR
jgi:hypothetical protein